MQSSDHDYLMNETRRNPTTGNRCPPPSFKQVARDLLYVQSHRHLSTYQGPWLPSLEPVGESQGGQFFRCEADSNRQPVNPQSTSLTTAPPRPLPPHIVLRYLSPTYFVHTDCSCMQAPFLFFLIVQLSKSHCGVICHVHIYYIQSDLVKLCFFNPHTSQSEHIFW